MHKPHKCIIDNWSLEHAGSLLENSSDLGLVNSDSFIRNLGGLSNFISALLLYDESFFVLNGFEKDWKRFDWFNQNASAFIEGIDLDDLAINWHSRSSYSDKGVKNYLLTSKYFESDLLVSPERSEKIALSKRNYLDNTFLETLKEIDKRINLEKNESMFKKIHIGIDRNFRLPSLTQYILSEASSREDLLTVIMQLKSDGKMAKVISEIEQMTSTTKGASKLERDIQRFIKKSFGKESETNDNLSISVPVFFLSFSKSINLDFFNRKEYMIFLRNLIACRSEALKLDKDIQRVFKKKLDHK